MNAQTNYTGHGIFPLDTIRCIIATKRYGTETCQVSMAPFVTNLRVLHRGFIKTNISLTKYVFQQTNSLCKQMDSNPIQSIIKM